ncbi:MAG: hypothetical protein OXE57_10280 [Alphaproteobacteria bacterium]|nr:hypothetical protein [Alphaproteobacteria bacterium]
MRKARKRKPGAGHSVSYTDAQWAQIKAWAEAAGETTSRWWARCVLTVDLSAPERVAAPPLVLDEEQQRRICRIAGHMAGGARGEVSARFGALARDLLRERLEAMVREGRRAEALDGLRTVFGEARAEVIAAAFIPETPAMADKPAGRPGEDTDPS